MKLSKRICTTLLALVLLLSTMPLQVGAATTHTADEAISWCQSKLGASLDYDGAYGAQCVDLTKYYYDYLGASAVSGNAYSYASNALPSGWTRIAGGVPQKGDILVYTGGYGHVAIFESTNISYHQNWSGQYVQRVERPYDKSFYSSYEGVTKTYWGCIRPNFTDAPSVTYTSIEPGIYYLLNVGNEKALCVSYAQDVNKQNIDLYTYEPGNKAEQFEITVAPDGYKMRPLCSDARVVNAWGTAPKNGSNVNLYDYIHDGTQWWKFEAVNGGYIVHNSFVPSCVLDVSGSNALITTRHGGASQIWKLVRVCQHTSTDISNYVEPTCSKEGYSGDRTCLECGEVIEVGKPLPTNSKHNYSAVVVPATPTEQGYTLHTCFDCGSAYTSDHTDYTGPLLGDVDLNGRVNTTDARITLQYAAGIIPLSLQQATTANVNGDNTVNTTDARLILQFAANIISKFPAE